ncbi:MAG: 4-alpha-glucanotransferase [Lachnospiraceae bacterium]|nr:4-alpha-glucanotransferase [Lachnospiraceae bacterium]
MRAAGILLPIFSLPGKYGIGSFSKEAFKFIDFLKEAGQSYWQILPVGPTGYGDSPYQTFSTFSGNPYFISLEALQEEGLLSATDLKGVDFGKDKTGIDYGRLYKVRLKVLRKAFKKSKHKASKEYKEFEKNNSDWIDDYALFMAIKARYKDVSFTEWPKEIRFRDKKTIEKLKDELSEDIEFQKFVQFKFIEQYYKVKKYANENGVKIIGDIPIYVSPDSSDLWTHPELFQTKPDGELKSVAGCPPDAFAATGQLWGNPVYNWPYHKKTGYKWWIRRMAKCSELYDAVRIDHFRGFDEYYAIEFGRKDATIGEWEKGPGIELFKALKETLGKTEIIAEDLGFITKSVRKLVRDTKFPNMKVLEFAFDSRDANGANEYLPHNYDKNCVVYTGTHDNETLCGWYHSIKPAERKKVRQYVNLKTRDTKKIADALVREAHKSVARLCIIPLQDYLGLDNTARINHPSTLGGNWVWRMKDTDLSAELAENILDITKTYGRI